MSAALSRKVGDAALQSYGGGRADPPPPLFLIKGGKLDLAGEPAGAADVLDTSRPELSFKPAKAEPAAKTKNAAIGRKWAAAILASCILHAGIAAFFLHLRDDRVKIAGGEEAGIAFAGNAPEDQLSAGDPATPAVANVTLITMLEAETAVANQAETLSPVETETAIERAQSPAVERLEPVEEARVAATVSEPLPEPPAERAPEVATPAAPAEEPQAATPAPVELATEILAADRAAPVNREDAVRPAPQPNAIQPAPLPEAVQPAPPPEQAVAVSEPAETVQPVPEPWEVEASKVAAELAALEEIPSPTPRPARPRPVERTQTAEKQPAKQPATQKPRQQAAGSGGRNEADRVRGTADGKKEGNRASASSGAGRNSAAGNAAVSNYPGKIVSKLRRALRYPAQAKRQRLRGEAHVQFTVSAGGGVGSVRVVKSSGSPILDQAAIDTVQRAAPFPAIPPEAGRSSWPFTVPLAFTR